MSTPMGTITGRVLGPSGAPLPGATVAIVSGTQPHRDIAAVTGADGTFRLGNVRPGDYRVQANAQGAVQTATVTVVGGGSADVEIRLA